LGRRQSKPFPLTSALVGRLLVSARNMPTADRPFHIFLQFFRSLWAMMSDMLRFTLPAVVFVPMSAPETGCTILFGLFYSPSSEIRWKPDFFHGLPRYFCSSALVIGDSGYPLAATKGAPSWGCPSCVTGGLLFAVEQEAGVGGITGYSLLSTMRPPVLFYSGC
jgi:hypothetical protein